MLLEVDALRDLLEERRVLRLQLTALRLRFKSSGRQTSLLSVAMIGGVSSSDFPVADIFG